MLKVSGLKVAYGAVEAVRGVDLDVEQGELVALLGANGAGKSSTLNALVGLSPLKAGRIEFLSEDIAKLPTEVLVRRGITLSPEGRRIFASLSVAENLRLGAYGRAERDQLDEAYDQVFALFPILKERETQLAGTLSGGQQQMLAIGRALMIGPKLLLLDEPSLGLAPQIVETIFELISALRDRGITILMVEQNVAMSLDIVDRGYVMAGGEIVAAGSAQELKASNVVENAYLGTG
ncbi:ABC transporter ATP-binding protein [Pelagibius sp. Alg239-R121]|uniref:ABC transporter ATP-binding protein n=1 Tax=Pelagibius sp. Alg239-R121 TaxID=2993448 RepID=UPI0024A72A5F|nr:ABC transporter ATP-binding protein [Pelagibius sp. Alg239-R121]